VQVSSCDWSEWREALRTLSAAAGRLATANDTTGKRNACCFVLDLGDLLGREGFLAWASSFSNPWNRTPFQVE
jgi:hypothetical protein